MTDRALKIAAASHRSRIVVWIKGKGLARQIFIYAAATVVAAIALFPFYWMAATSVKSPAEVYFYPPTLFPSFFTLDNYQRMLTSSIFLRYFLNSTLVASASVMLVLLISIPAGYSLGRMRYRGRKHLSRFIFVFYLFPGVLLLVPLYMLISKLQLHDNPLGLVLVYTTFEAPYATILIRQYLLNIPKDIEDSALVDGANRWRVIWSIIVPLARPGIMVAAISTFIASWSEFIMASILTTSQSNKTLPVGLYEWMGTYDIEWGSLTAGAVLTAVPILVLFAFMGRVFIQGLLSGSIKG